MAFNAQALWDLTSPITMPAMSDNDFLMLLEKQMQAAHPTSGNPGTDGQQSFLNDNFMISPSSVMAPPAPAHTMTPPLTEEPSPSPPASNGDTTFGDGSKRKASSDDSGNPENQPRNKVHKAANEDSVNSQPTEESNKKAPARRKSSGNAGATEENRQAKRKEQNRAAQRAFRDRKEKHVRDLEDKIQELEEKFNTSESENTNLKDLLARLQNENMMLKQSAFTFEFAPTDKSNNLAAISPTTNTSSSLSSVGSNPFTSPSHSHSQSSASPESATANYVAKSPNNSLFTTNNTPSPNMNAPFDSRDNITINSAGIMTFSNPSTVQPTPVTPALSMQSPGAGPSSISQGAFNHTSLFTSYRDSSYTLGLPFGDFNTFGSAANSGIAAEFGMDFGMDMTGLSANDLGAFGLGSDFDDLFGGQLGALEGTNSYGGVGSVTSPSSTDMATSAPTPQSTSASTAPTPAPSQAPLIIDGLPSAGESARVECSIKAPSASDWRRCPKTKQDFVDLIRNDNSKPSTFGPALSSDDKARIEQDWQQFKEHPEAKELDVDNLCHELFDKAQCTELKSRMKQSMMRIAKDMANGPSVA